MSILTLAEMEREKAIAEYKIQALEDIRKIFNTSSITDINIGNLIYSFVPIGSPKYKLCLGNDNILLKEDYPELYEIIDDAYRFHALRELLDSEFCIPRYDGHYLVGTKKLGEGEDILEEHKFISTEDSIMAFRIHSKDDVAKYPYMEDSNVSSPFKLVNKNIAFNGHTGIPFVNKLELLTDIPHRTSVSIDDRAIYIYMRVK